MIKSEIIHNGFKYKQLYFLENEVDIYDGDWDILRIYQSMNQLENTNSFYTLFTDLTMDLDDIRKQFSKTIRQEINRNIKKDKIDIEIIAKPTFEQIDESVEHYIEFKEFKNLTTDVEYMQKSFYAIQNNLIIFRAKYNNDYLIYHTYIADNKRTKLKTSSSSRNHQDRDLINLVSRTNKRMHYEAIKYFHSTNKSIYDWGGVNKDFSDGVSRFKKMFGGYLVEEYEGLIFRNLFIKLRYLKKELGYLGILKKILKN